MYASSAWEEHCDVVDSRGRSLMEASGWAEQHRWLAKGGANVRYYMHPPFLPRAMCELVPVGTTHVRLVDGQRTRRPQRASSIAFWRPSLYWISSLLGGVLAHLRVGRAAPLAGQGGCQRAVLHAPALFAARHVRASASGYHACPPGGRAGSAVHDGHRGLVGVGAADAAGPGAGCHNA